MLSTAPIAEASPDSAWIGVCRVTQVWSLGVLTWDYGYVVSQLFISSRGSTPVLTIPTSAELGVKSFQLRDQLFDLAKAVLDVFAR